MTSQKGWSSSKLNCKKHDEKFHFCSYSAEQRAEDWVHEVGNRKSTSEGGIERSQRWSVSTWIKPASQEGDL